jgi:hypothetical protein
MRYVNLTPEHAAQALYKGVLNDIVTLQSIDTARGSVTLRRVDPDQITPSSFGLDRPDRLRRRILNSGGKGTSVREVMEEVGGLWRFEYLNNGVPA